MTVKLKGRDLVALGLGVTILVLTVVAIIVVNEAGYGGPAFNASSLEVGEMINWAVNEALEAGKELRVEKNGSEPHARGRRDLGGVGRNNAKTPVSGPDYLEDQRNYTLWENVEFFFGFGSG